MSKPTWLFLIVMTLVVMLCLAAPVAAHAAQESQGEDPPHLGYGMMLAYPPTYVSQTAEAGFDWFKYFLYWNQVEPQKDGVYDWTAVDTQMGWACQSGLNMLIRVERDSEDWTPIQDGEMAGWEAFFQALAARIDARRAACGYRFRVALEIWNEPNLDFQWHHQPLDPARYTEMVRRAYTGAKAGSPHILIVAGSLAPTGGTGDGRAMDDVVYLEAMYDAGLHGYFDALSIHNYGYGGAPEDKAWGSGLLNFRRAEDIRAVMVARGDVDKPVWGTEFGWLLDEAACVGHWEGMGFAWQRVSEEQQADYLTRAFAYADANWPWMEVMIVSNLDFSSVPWYAPCDPLRYFAVLNADNTPRLAYTALQSMPKRQRDWGVWGMAAEPAALAWEMRLAEHRVLTSAVTIANTGEQPFTWTVATYADAFALDATPATGTPGEALHVTADARDLPVGVHRGVITITAASQYVPQSPITLPVTLEVTSTWGMAVTPPALSWMLPVSETRLLTADLTVENTGDQPFEWHVAAQSPVLGITTVPTSSWGPTGTLTLQAGVFRVFVNPCGLPAGSYTGALTVTTVPTSVPGSPFVVPLRVHLVEQIYPVYLPLVVRGD